MNKKALILFSIGLFVLAIIGWFTGSRETAVRSPGMIPVEKSQVFRTPEPVVLTPEPVVRSTGVCGNWVCEPGEGYYSCPKDCADVMVIFPYESDVASCTDSTGKVWPATGPGAATWFNWNGCSREKSYQVNSGGEIFLHAYTDACADCVCTYANFCVYELRNGGWQQAKCFDPGIGPGSYKFQPYTPDSDRIKITAARCFYLEVLGKK